MSDAIRKVPRGFKEGMCGNEGIGFLLGLNYGIENRNRLIRNNNGNY